MKKLVLVNPNYTGIKVKNLYEKQFLKVLETRSPVVINLLETDPVLNSLYQFFDKNLKDVSEGFFQIAMGSHLTNDPEFDSVFDSPDIDSFTENWNSPSYESDFESLVDEMGEQMLRLSIEIKSNGEVTYL